MRLKALELHGFKSFAHKSVLEFDHGIVSIVGPNGSGKSNVVEAVRYVLGEQSMKSMRGKQGSDLIFKGSKSLSKGTRASVTIYFDNADKVFKLSGDGGENINLNFDTISISREVYPDGQNKYSLNGSDVRLKDIHNLLSSVNIGSSGHHIISQGEADRILSANAKERKEMVEDALGLKIYQYKIKESERKLERTKENMKEVTLQRRENAPHLKFLEKQMEKFEKTKEMQNELFTLYREYLKNEYIYLEEEKSRLDKEKEKFSSELKDVTRRIADASGEASEKENKKINELNVLEKKINELRVQKNEMERKLGRLEGTLDSKEAKLKLSGKCPLCGNEVREIHPEQLEKRRLEEEGLTELKKSHKEMLVEIEKLNDEEVEGQRQVEALKTEINKEMQALRDLEREKFTWKVKHQELSSALELLSIKQGNLKERSGAFEIEIKEGDALVGERVLSYKDFKVEGDMDLGLHEEQKKKIDRLKIRLEDTGLGGGSEVIKEFKEVSERDQFLAKEIEDLEKSVASLEELIVGLKDKIDEEFKEGVKKINVEFQKFFVLMFGGGHGSLDIVVENKKKRKIEHDRDMEEDMDFETEDEDVAPEQGIEIDVSLPHKKVKELHALSGGERSLTSIALLFAMSQVNPPPFLVLDETDAALDEANSRKYGDMIEKLSKHSQLVVVTHNRETMSRAGILYGITVGADGASKLLSVRFEEAVQIAK